MQNPSNKARFACGTGMQLMPLAVVARPMSANDPSANTLGRLFSRQPFANVYVQRIRRKVDEDFPEKIIETTRGVGYRIKADT